MYSPPLLEPVEDLDALAFERAEGRIPGAEGIAGLIAFYDDQVDVVVEPLPAESSSE